MTETTHTPSGSRTSGTQTPGNALQTGSALDDEKGSTKIADGVVAKVAGIAAREVSGVYGLGGSASRAIGNVTQRVGISESRSQGVSVEVDEHDASVVLTIVVEYGESIPTVTQEIREQIIKRVEGICGLRVAKVDITVDDLHFDGDNEEDQRG